MSSIENPRIKKIKILAREYGEQGETVGSAIKNLREHGLTEADVRLIRSEVAKGAASKHERQIQRLSLNSKYLDYKDLRDLQEIEECFVTNRALSKKKEMLLEQIEKRLELILKFVEQGSER